LQGTSRPAHYIVLHDGNKFNVDTLVIIINVGRNQFSIPPIYYAHSSARQARTNAILKGTYELRPVLPTLAQCTPYEFTYFSYHITSHHIDITSHHIDITSHHIDIKSHHIDITSHHIDITPHHIDIISYHIT
ncbi:10854_t:CDS:1, partial [Ambispora gerdemannii]